MAKSRADCVKRTRETIWDKEKQLQMDIQKEQTAREQSVQVIKDCVQRDYPNLKAAIQQEVSDRELADTAIASTLEHTL